MKNIFCFITIFCLSFSIKLSGQTILDLHFDGLLLDTLVNPGVFMQVANRDSIQLIADLKGNAASALCIGGPSDLSYSGLRIFTSNVNSTKDSTDFTIHFLTKRRTSESTDGSYVYIDFFRKKRNTGASSDAIYNANTRSTLTIHASENCDFWLQSGTLNTTCTGILETIQSERWNLYLLVYKHKQRLCSLYVNNRLIRTVDWVFPLADSLVSVQFGRLNEYLHPYPNSLSPVCFDAFKWDALAYDQTSIQEVYNLYADYIETDTPTANLDFLEKANQDNLVQIYPNPTSGFLYVSNLNTPIQFKIINISGACVFEQMLTQSKHILDLSTISNGLYTIIWQDNDGNQHKKRLVLNR